MTLVSSNVNHKGTENLGEDFAFTVCVPGVSIIVMFRSSGEFTTEPSNFVRKEFPNCCKLSNGWSACLNNCWEALTAKQQNKTKQNRNSKKDEQHSCMANAWPGITRSFSP